MTPSPFGSFLLTVWRGLTTMIAPLKLFYVRFMTAPYIVRALTGPERYEAEREYDGDVTLIWYGIISMPANEVLAVSDDLSCLIDLIRMRGFNVKCQSA